MLFRAIYVRTHILRESHSDRDDRLEDYKVHSFINTKDSKLCQYFSSKARQYYVFKLINNILKFLSELKL